MNKEDKFSIGRPKLADTKLKKKSYIMLGISALLIMILLSGTLVSLSVLPKTKKLKGEVSCSSIPDYLAYNEETNPNGFKDINFYNVVIRSYNYNGSQYCNTITEEQLATITSLNANGRNITDANGIQYLTGLTILELYNNQLTSIDLSKNIALEYLDLDNNQLTSIDLSKNTVLTRLDIRNNQLSSINLSHNTLLTIIYLQDNHLTSIDLSQNTALREAYLHNNQLTNINVWNTTEDSAEVSQILLDNNKLSSLDVSKSNVAPLIANNKFDKTINIMLGESVDFPILMKEEIKKLFEEQLNLQINIEDDSIISIDDNKITGLKSGTTHYIYKYDGDGGYFSPVYYETKVNVIELTSDKYTIDNKNKTIDLKGANINSVSKKDFKLTPGKVVIDGDKLTIVIDKEEIFEYTLTNYSDKPTTTTTKADDKKVSESKNSNVKTTTKKSNNIFNIKTTTVKSDDKVENKNVEKIYLNKYINNKCKNNCEGLKKLLVISCILNVVLVIGCILLIFKLKKYKKK